MMKKHFFLFASFLVMTLGFSSCSSCGNNKESREERVTEFRSTLNHEDTTQMLKICDDAMEQLKHRNYNAVLSSLYEYNDSTNEVKPLSSSTAKRYTTMFRMFPVLDYHRLYFSFQLEGCNDVKYEVTWATAEQAGTKDPATTAYMFNPVKVDGEWKLCVKTSNEEIDQSLR